MGTCYAGHVATPIIQLAPRVLCAALTAALCACSAGSSNDRDPVRTESEDGTTDPLELVMPPAEDEPQRDLGEVDDHGILGIEPNRGPFSGGQSAWLRGRGFASNVRVWIGDREVSPEDVLATRADRIQIVVPPGSPGLSDVTTQNGADEATRRTLPAGYGYDAFYAEPRDLDARGGETLTLVGLETGWDLESEVLIDLQPCVVQELRDLPGGMQELDCVTPAGTDGEKNIQVIAPGGSQSVVGGVRYVPPAAPRGGVSGDPITDELQVTVVDLRGEPIADAFVIVGSEVDGDTIGQPGSSVQRTPLSGSVTVEWQPEQSESALPMVTVAAECFQPLTIVDVARSELRLSLRAELSPACGSTPPNLSGGSSSTAARVQGELIWPGAIELQRAPWTNVPVPSGDGDRRAAYVFEASASSGVRFSLPREDRAITPASGGVKGYSYELTSSPGVRTFYAVAGIENRTVSPPRFTPFAMGVVKGVAIEPNDQLDGIGIAMNRMLDQQLELSVAAPLPTERGPHQLFIEASVEVERGRFLALPGVGRVLSVPGPSQSSLLGLPALAAGLAGSRYVVRAHAQTDTLLGPSSSIDQVLVTHTGSPVEVGGFPPVPVLSLGAGGELSWTRELSANWQESLVEADLLLFEVSSGGGLVRWTVAAPPSAGSVRLPNLSALPAGDLIEGPLEVAVHVASYPTVDYSSLSLSDMSAGAWAAYSSDRLRTVYIRTSNP